MYLKDRAEGVTCVITMQFYSKFRFRLLAFIWPPGIWDQEQWHKIKMVQLEKSQNYELQEMQLNAERSCSWLFCTHGTYSIGILPYSMGGGVLSHLSCKDRSIYLYLYIVRKIRNRCSDLLKRMQTYKTSVWGKNNVCPTNSKVHIWSDHLSSSKQPELS